MPPQRAILVPGHGVSEAVRAVRFIPQRVPSGPASGSSGQPAEPVLPTIVEIWLGDFYGDATGEMLASRSATDRTEFAFAEKEMPVIAPERSLVLVLRDPPARWSVEFDCILKEDVLQEGRRATIDHGVDRHVTIDNFGTARESLGSRSREPVR